MSTSSRRDIRAAVALRLAEIDGSGDYHTAAGLSLAYGLEGLPHTSGPCIRYRLGALESTRSPGATGSWERSIEVRIEGHIGGGAGALDDGEDAADELREDIERALLGDVTLGGLVVDLEEHTAELDGPTIEANSGLWVVSVSARYVWRDEGVGA